MPWGWLHRSAIETPWENLGRTQLCGYRERPVVHLCEGGPFASFCYTQWVAGEACDVQNRRCRRYCPRHHDIHPFITL